MILNLPIVLLRLVLELISDDASIVVIVNKYLNNLLTLRMSSYFLDHDQTRMNNLLRSSSIYFMLIFDSSMNNQFIQLLLKNYEFFVKKFLYINVVHTNTSNKIIKNLQKFGIHVIQNIVYNVRYITFSYERKPYIMATTYIPRRKREIIIGTIRYNNNSDKKILNNLTNDIKEHFVLPYGQYNYNIGRVDCSI